jgi:hypothetical protein
MAFQIVSADCSSALNYFTTHDNTVWLIRKLIGDFSRRRRFAKWVDAAACFSIIGWMEKVDTECGKLSRQEVS